MNRREFLATAGATTVAVAWGAQPACAATAGYGNVLVLVELKGGNDGLNTVIPFADPAYYALRPQLAIPREQVLALDAATGLHPALQPLLALWQARELAVVQGVGYPDANLSHFRSIEIWDTASRSNQYLPDGWLARVFKAAPVPREYAADGVVVGGGDMGPFAGGARAVAIVNTEQFLRQARLAQPASAATGSGALAHILKIEREVAQAAAGLSGDHHFSTAFPVGAFGNAVRTAAQVIAAQPGVAAVKIGLGSFDTHRGQLATHARLLKELAEGLTALKAALVELRRWDSTLVMTYSEFGRRAAENLSGGTDHGTASAHFALGGRVRGGLYGLPPALTRLDGNGNLSYGVDFRDLYATVLGGWWGVSPDQALGARFQPVGFVRA